MEDSMQRRAHLPVSDLALGSAKSPDQRPAQRGQLPAQKPAHRDPRPPRALPNLDRSRPAVNIPQRRRMGVR
ncbi:hypothetical protein SOCE836_066820 [Sorangium cellulosum]|uniref:Uncharacterized protein n=2 Tax=Polyangiaceae TaxID=49 RepID=A0A4P2QWC2_SORCE|nr:hypothetical protein SOCE836_066820 [Sorangium cellulosum]